MRNLFFTALIAAIVFTSCSDDDPSPVTPAEKMLSVDGKWQPLSFSIGNETHEHLILDCENDLVSFSENLSLMMTGNMDLTVNASTNCSTCEGFDGSITWESRCTPGSPSSGIWVTSDAGESVTFDQFLPGGEEITLNNVHREDDILYMTYYKTQSEYVTIKLQPVN